MIAGVFLLFSWGAASAGVMQFPPCDQINAALCSTARLSVTCASMCGNGEGASGRPVEWVTLPSRATGQPATGHPGNTSRPTDTDKCNKVDPCVDQATANAAFLDRCKTKGIKESCLEKCRYDVTFDEMKKAILSGVCPAAGMRDYLKAGANDQDNTGCCQKTGVLDGKRSFCFPFCNPNGDTWPTQKQALRYLPCASQMAQILRCHWASLTPV